MLPASIRGAGVDARQLAENALERCPNSSGAASDSPPVIRSAYFFSRISRIRLGNSPGWAKRVDQKPRTARRDTGLGLTTKLGWPERKNMAISVQKEAKCRILTKGITHKG